MVCGNVTCRCHGAFGGRRYLARAETKRLPLCRNSRDPYGIVTIGLELKLERMHAGARDGPAESAPTALPLKLQLQCCHWHTQGTP